MYPSLEIMIPEPTTAFLPPPLNSLVPLFFLELILITEGEVCYFITTGPDKSPLILSKNVI